MKRKWFYFDCAAFGFAYGIAIADVYGLSGIPFDKFSIFAAFGAGMAAVFMIQDQPK